MTKLYNLFSGYYLNKFVLFSDLRNKAVLKHNEKLCNLYSLLCKKSINRFFKYKDKIYKAN